MNNLSHYMQLKNQFWKPSISLRRKQNEIPALKNYRNKTFPVKDSGITKAKSDNLFLILIKR